jgi:D-threo-aldose 1-dehydrogenase
MTIDPTERVVLGRSDVAVTRFGFGTMTIGGFQSAMSDEQADAVLGAAWDAGVRFFDTAPQYGCGLAEERLGAFLRSRARADAVVATKVGKRIVPLGSGGETQPLFPGGHDHEMAFDYSYDGTLRIIDKSLQRLGLSSLDLVLIHDITRHFHGDTGVHARADEAMAGAVRALQKLKSQGVVRAWGTGLKDVDIVMRFVRETDIDCALVPGRMTLLDQSCLDGLTDFCAARGVSIIAAAAFDSGILATGAVQGSTYGYRPADDTVLDRVQRIEKICTTHGVPLQSAALQFPFRAPAVAGLLVSMRSERELNQNLDWMRRPIPETLWDDLGRSGLVRVPKAMA